MLLLMKLFFEYVIILSYFSLGQITNSRNLIEWLGYRGAGVYFLFIEIAFLDKFRANGKRRFDLP